jgi:cytochrome P450
MVAPRVDVDPFAAGERALDDPDPGRQAMRAAGPIVRVDAPAGGPVWVVTEDALARAVLVDPRVVKDPAFAPAGWDARSAGLEPTAARQPSLTTSDGAAHGRLRRAHAPLFGARRMHERYPQLVATARELLSALAAVEQPVDLMADFTTRYPLTVICDLLGVPRGMVDQAADACRRVLADYPADFDVAMGQFAQLAAAALAPGQQGLAAELRDRLPDDPDSELHYHLFGLIFAGQLTTDAALGYLLVRLLDGGPGAEADADEVVRETLRRHPSAPFSLWRFTTAEIELAGTVLPARAPVLVDIAGINNAPDRPDRSDLAFGAGHHYCLGAQLAQLELRAVAEVLRADHPTARLAVPSQQLRRTDFGGTLGNRIVALPVSLTG